MNKSYPAFMIAVLILTVCLQAGCSLRGSGVDEHPYRPKTVKWSYTSPNGKYVLEIGDGKIALFDKIEERVINAFTVEYNTKPTKVEWTKNTRYVVVHGRNGNEMIIPSFEQ